MRRAKQGAARAAALFASGLALLLAGTTVHAQASASLAVGAQVGNACLIATTPVDFGTYDPVATHASSPLLGTGSVTITCTRGVASRITLSPGQHNVGTNRRMANGAERLRYELYRPPSATPDEPCGRLTTEWRTSAARSLVPGPAPGGAPRTFNVCGEVFAGQNVAPGTYTDVVIASVIF